MWSVSPQFTAALRSPSHTFRVKAQVLDTDFNVIAGGEFFEANRKLTDIQNLITDGNVDVDLSRGPRRQFQMTLLNKNAEFSPNSDWAGTFYVDRLIRVWRGIQLGESVEWVPVGTFMIDDADVINERNMSLVVLSGTDLWKKFNKADLDRTKKFTAGTNIVDVIEWLATYAGVTRMTLDHLADRTSDGKLLASDITYEKGDKVADLLKKIGTDWGLDIYFDQLGRFRSEDMQSPADKAVVWHYKPETNSLLISAKGRYNDDTLYNVAVVTGTKNQDSPVTSELKDTDPTSPTNVTRIGRRVNRLESDQIGTQDQADAACRKLYLSGFFTKEILDLEAVCNPALDANDVVRITEPDKLKVDLKYRLQAFSVPLNGSRQTLKVQRLVAIS